MSNQATLSFRASPAFAKKVSVYARKMGVSRSEYTRIAVEELNRRLMSERIKALSLELSESSRAAAEAMDPAISDGLNA